MSITAAPGTTFEAVAANFATGLSGTIGVRVIDNAGATTLPRVTAGIVEYPAGSGIYAKTLTAPSVAGQFTVVWDNGATTPGNVATEDLVVTYTPLAAATGTLYITRDEMRTALSYTAGATYADADIDMACETVSRAIDRACGKTRRFYQATETRYYTPDAYWGRNRYFSNTECRLEIDDLTTCTTLTVDTGGSGSYATTWVEGTDFFLDPPNAAADGEPFTEVVLRSFAGRSFPAVQRAVKIVGVFGWPAVPVEVSQYAKIFAAQLVLRSRQAPFGILMQGMEVGATARLMRVDPDFNRLLGTFVKSRPFL